MPQPIVQVDAFTDHPFAGNPAAVCVLDAPADERWMSAVAAEMNLSETAYAVAPATPGDPWGLRWFTPTVEVDLCGHATLATSHVLFGNGHVDGDLIRFATRSGELTARRLDDGWIELDFPAHVPNALDPSPGLLDALGVDPAAVVATVRGPADWLVHLASTADVLACQPDLRALREIPCTGVIVTAVAEAPYDFASRFFAPAVGIDEDPVTGAIHCLLAPYWSSRLGTTTLLAHQSSARGGTLRLEHRGDRVGIAGQAVTVLTGTLAP